MARTAEATRLTREHRRTQQRIAAEVLRQVLALWPMLDPSRLDATAPAWTAATLRPIQAGHTMSARAALSYLQAYRLAEGVRGVLPAFPMPAFSAEAARTSLIVTGPVAIKKATGSLVPLEVSTRNALTMVSGSAQRHVLNGGRDTVVNGTSADDLALGYARVSAPDACAFCLMLAGRGAVYKSEYDAGFLPHDHCWCQPEPAYEGYQLTDTAREAAALWDSARSEETGGATLEAFRQVVAAQRAAQ